MWQKLPGWAGRRVAAWLGGWPPQAAFLDGSTLRRPQGFHNPGNGLSKKSRVWRRGRASKTLPRPLTRFYVIAPFVQPCLGRRISYGLRSRPSPRAGDTPHTCSSPGLAPHPPHSRLLLAPSLTPYTSTTLPRRSSFPPGTSPISYRSWPLLIHSPHSLEPPGLPLSLEKAHASAWPWPVLHLRSHFAPVSGLLVFAYAVPLARMSS